MATENTNATQQPTEFGPNRKPMTYDLLGRLNAAFGRVYRNLDSLGQVGVFDTSEITRLKNAADVFQADTNCTLLDALRTVEQRDRKVFRKPAKK